MDIPHSIYPSLVDGHLDYFQFRVIINKVAINICKRVFMLIYVFISLGKISGKGIRQSYDNCRIFKLSHSSGPPIAFNCGLTFL